MPIPMVKYRVPINFFRNIRNNIRIRETLN